VVEPPAGKVATGWVAGEEPPSSWFNWWQRLVGDWTRWLESLISGLTGRVTTLEGEMDAAQAIDAQAALKNAHNTFLKSQVINTESNWADDPLLTTTAKPGDDPTDLSAVPAAPGSNRWKVGLAMPTQGLAWAGIFVGQSPYGAALVNNARWHVPTQKWRQIDPAYVSTAMVGRSGQWIVSHVPAGASPWTDWPLDAGGDFIAGGNIGAHSDFAYVPAHTSTDWTIPLSCSSGETFMQTDGSYKVGSNGASWPLKVPDLTVLSDIYVLTYQASAALSYAALVRRNKGVVVGGGPPLAFPTQEPVAEKNSVSGIGFQTLTLNCNGHIAETASWEYSVIYKRAHADDLVGRIAMNQFVNVGPRNLG
jgi:hypothetical protein